jgi:chromosome segregation ATPase
MRSFFVVILGMMLFSLPGLAQENNITTGVSALREEVLAAKENVIKKQVLQLQTQLGRLRAEGESLNKEVTRSQDKNLRQSPKISLLEKENSDLDDRIQKAQGSVKLTQLSLDAANQEAQKLLVLSPQAGVRALAHQELLKKQVKDLEDEIAAFPPEKPLASFGFTNQWDDKQLRQLESQLKVLEKNYGQLKDLVARMSKKIQSPAMVINQRTEGEKLKRSIDDLNLQSMGLKADLDDLRTQMVELDKRKSQLETMAQQAP